MTDFEFDSTARDIATSFRRLNLPAAQFFGPPMTSAALARASALWRDAAARSDETAAQLAADIVRFMDQALDVEAEFSRGLRNE